MTYYIEINNQKIPYEIKKTSRKSYAIAVKAGGVVVVKMPKYGSVVFAKKMVSDRADWVYESYLKMKEIEPKKSAKDKSDYEKRLEEPYRKAAKEYIPKRVAYYADLLGVTYGTISIRDQKTRWGSCSTKGNLNFNYRLMLAPPKVLDYVVIHELCHRKEMNHSPKFWAHVESVMPDYKEYRKWLKKNGNSLSIL